MKVINSMKNIALPEEIYKPTLSWFSKADIFLNDITREQGIFMYIGKYV
jgi:hypothetical protein